MKAVVVKINFTKKQYKTLLDLAYLGEWTANSAVAHTEHNETYEEMFYYICSFANSFGYKDLVTFDQEFQSYFPSQEYVAKMYEVIEANDVEVFWSMLPKELAKRDEMKEKNLPSGKEAKIKRFFELEE